MHTNGSEQIRIGRAENDSHRGTSGEAGDIDAQGIDCPLRAILLHATHNIGDTSWLSTAAILITGRKPVPAQSLIGFAKLLWINDNKAMLLGQLIHPCSSGEVERVLPAAM